MAEAPAYGMNTLPTPPTKDGMTGAETHRIHIKNADMTEEMQERVVELAKAALLQQMAPREMAGFIKKEFDRIYGAAWHCIVGKAFGSFVTHGIFFRLRPINHTIILMRIEANCFIFFYIDNWAVMLFKTA